MSWARLVCLGKTGPILERADCGERIGESYGTSTFTPEQIIAKLREADVLVGRGSTAVEACRQIGISEQALYRWRKEYGGLKVDQARRMKDLERENARLKRLVADLALDKAILQEASKLTF
ncbi:MAG: transposase [Afipia sp.]|jgi:putative transposase|nr:hypothetical protein [Hyphomicrobium sp.]MBR2120619.1 transposase [Afipia sp.]MDR7062380.1 transposase-like protein [Sphingopyxis sp. BE235]MDR7182837.1 transposase-like protein [Sphingopyxis sp. BE249]